MAKKKEGKLVLDASTTLMPKGYEAKGLGITPLNWRGSDLPGMTGGLPAGYIGNPGYREFIRGSHKPGHFSFGPYHVPAGLGALTRLFFLLDASDLGGADADVLTADLTDYNQNGQSLATPITVRVRDLKGRPGIVIQLKGSVEVKPSMKIESRVFAHGGASLRLFAIHWGIEYI